jgi:hypothetical protein
MFRLTFIAMAVAAVMTAPSASAQPQVQDPGQSVQTDTPAAVPAGHRPNRHTDPNARRCVSTTTVGSRLSRRVCHTNAEWDEIEGAARRQAAESGQGRSMRCDGDSSACGQGGRVGGLGG